MDQERQRFEHLIQSISQNGRLMSLGHLLEWACKRYTKKTALICRDREITYEELFARACMFSDFLRKQGIKKDDRVLLLLENSIEFYIAYFGIVQIGAVVAPLNVYLTERELRHIIDDAQAVALVTDRSFLHRIEKVQAAITVILKEDSLVLENSIETVSCDIATKDPHELALLLYTSGTTGLPKGVMLSSANALINAMQGIARQKIKRCRVLCVLPLFHSFAQNTCVWMALLYGCTVIVVPKIDRRLILEGLAKKPSIFLGVPALYGLLCLLKTAPIDGIDLFVSGGDALPDRIRSAFALIYNRKICSGYGLTETSPLLSVDLEDVVEKTSCVGTPCIDVAIEVRDNDGTVLKQGNIGQLWVKGPNVMLGYHNAPEATERVLQDGWFNTEDRAYINKRGKLVIAGRQKDLIIHKGFNIYPQEIENILLHHPRVLRVAVIPQDDPAGQVPIAVIQARGDTEGMVLELQELCRKQLAAYKIPKKFIVIQREPPLTATGKINKKQLEAWLDEQT